MAGQDNDASPEPAPLAEVLSGLLEYSDLLDGQLRMRLAAFRDGYRRGRETGYAKGRRDEAAETDRAWNRIARDVARARDLPHADLERKRWTVRGEPGTRETFSKPRRGDYTGNGTAE